MKNSLLSESKFLSLVLRHQPQVIGLSLDAQGWLQVDALLQAAAAHGTHLSEAELQEIVERNEKQRFEWDRIGGRIRANQGHSVPVNLEWVASPPPEKLYHGTGLQNTASIERSGLNSGKRLHVHLSADPDTAKIVGTRHGKPKIYAVASGAMARDGYAFYQSKNGVWLTESVPAAYLSAMD